jgi:peptidoglycan/xylan/chitin deacetylase (PgdA/CDA1 family)
VVSGRSGIARAASITIVMYHYVRDLKRSRFPEIKGLDAAEFEGQVEYIRRHYAPITMEQLIVAVRGEHELPRNAILLTFDDGYIDHYECVLPVLAKHRIQGSFFPPARPVLEHVVLDVNKIHFVLAAVADKSQIVRYLFSEIRQHMESHRLEAPETYYSRLAVASRYDEPDVVFIKKALQTALPENLRARFAANLFERFVTGDEKAFAAELYMSVEQLKEMCSRGMHVGSHGFSHYWMDTLSAEQQNSEVELALAFLSGLGCDMKNWTMCYPYGAYDERLLRLLRARNCALGLSTRVAVADLRSDEYLTLPRIDTNDLPKSGEASPNDWTMKSLSLQG